MKSYQEFILEFNRKAQKASKAGRISKEGPRSREKSEPSAVVTVGLPASGKSSLAKHMAAKGDTDQHELDKSRKELGKGPAYFGQDIVKHTYDGAKKSAEQGRSTVLSNTSIPKAHRKDAINRLKDVGYEKVTAVLAPGSKKAAMRRNRKRTGSAPGEGAVPQFVMNRMAQGMDSMSKADRRELRGNYKKLHKSERFTKPAMKRSGAIKEQKTFAEFIDEALIASLVKAAARQIFKSRGLQKGLAKVGKQVPKVIKLPSKVTGFQTARGSKYTYERKPGSWPTTQRTAVHDPYHPTPAGKTQKSTATMFTTPDASLEMKRRFQYEPKTPYHQGLPLSKTPGIGKAPVEVFNNYDKLGDRSAIHAGNPITDLKTKLPGPKNNIGLFGSQRKELKTRVSTALQNPNNRAVLKKEIGMKEDYRKKFGEFIVESGLKAITTGPSRSRVGLDRQRKDASERAAFRRSGMRRSTSGGRYPHKFTTTGDQNEYSRTTISSYPSQSAYARDMLPDKDKNGKGVVKTQDRALYLKRLKRQLKTTRTEREVHNVDVLPRGDYKKNDPKQLVSRGKEYHNAVKEIPQEVKKSGGKPGDKIVGKAAEVMPGSKDVEKGRKSRRKLYSKILGATEYDPITKIQVATVKE
jgi:predicted kinase